MTTHVGASASILSDGLHRLRESRPLDRIARVGLVGRGITFGG